MVFKRATLPIITIYTSKISSSNSRKRFRHCYRYRKNSTTFGKHVAIDLNDENNKQLIIRSGFAHVFFVLSKTAIYINQIIILIMNLKRELVLMTLHKGLI